MAVVVLEAAGSDTSALEAAIRVRGYPVTHAQSCSEVEELCRVQAIQVCVVCERKGKVAQATWLREMLELAPELCMVLVGSGTPVDLDYHPRLRVVDDSGDAHAVLDEVSAWMIASYVDPSQANAAANLNEAKAEYAASLPERVEAVAQAVKAARLETGPLDLARHLAHRIYGSAAAYGFAQIGQLAGELEESILDAFERGQIGDEDWRVFRSVLERLAESAGRPIRPSVRETLQSLPPRTTNVLVVSDRPAFVESVRASAPDQVELVQVRPDDLRTLPRGLNPVGAIIENVPVDEQAAERLTAALRARAKTPSLPILFIDENAASSSPGSRNSERPTLPLIKHLRFGEPLALKQWLSESASSVLRVLIVDQDPDFVAEAAAALAPLNVDVQTLPSTHGLLTWLDGVQPDVIVMDATMPEVSGLEMCRALRASAAWSATPIFLALEQGGPTLVARAYRAGATDVISKPLIKDELLARVGARLTLLRLGG